MIRIAALVAFVALVGCKSTITIHSEPSGASITVNGVPAGTTPSAIDVSEGDPIWLKLDGYYPRQVVLRRGGGSMVYMPSGNGTGGGVFYQEGALQTFYKEVLERDPDQWPKATAGTSPAPSSPTSKVAEAAGAPTSPAKPKFCTQCGATLAEKARFCGDCGASR